MSLPEKSADELRAEIVGTFTAFKPHAERYHAYAEKIVALSELFHVALLKERGASSIEEATLITVLDVRETPAKLEKTLTPELVTSIKRVIFDRTKGQFYLFA